MKILFERIIEGGVFFMVPIVLLLILIMVLIVKGILQRNQDNTKTISLIASISLFTIVWGFLGQTIGLITAFDYIHGQGDVSMGTLAGGLKVSFLAPLFAMFTFLIGRIGIIILTWMGKE